MKKRRGVFSDGIKNKDLSIMLESRKAMNLRTNIIIKKLGKGSKKNGGLFKQDKPPCIVESQEIN